jgi:cell wall-associated NlpC family hydrolase
MVEVIVQDAARQCQQSGRVTSTGSKGYGAFVILLTTLVGGCAARGAVPAPFPTVTSAKSKPEAPVARPSSLSEEGEAGSKPVGTVGSIAAFRPEVVQHALRMLGRPYAAGGSGPERFDCSGLVQYAYALAGFSVPRTVSEQLEASEPVPRDAVAPGDLLFFRISDGKPSHVGIALGDGTFVHAPSERGEVRIERLDSEYWTPRFYAARRVPMKGEGVR